MAGFLCQQSVVYIVQYIILNIISIFIFGPNLVFQIFANKFIHVLSAFLIPLILLQVLCHFKGNKTAWGSLIILIIFNIIMMISIIVDPKIKQKVEEDMKKYG